MISGFSANAISQLQDAFGGGGGSTTVVFDFARLANEVARLGATAEVIANTLSNPTWVEGDELCRRAATALKHEWYEDARRDAEASIDTFPYRAAPYLFLGLAQLNLEEATTAYDSLLRAIDYGRAAEPDHPAAATAGLLAANLAYAAGGRSEAQSVLLKADAATNNRCPQLTVAVAGAGRGSSASLAQLLRDDPAAWIDVKVDDSLFGSEGDELSAAYLTLLDATDKTIAQAERFHKQVAAMSSGEMDFYKRLYNTGGAPYYFGAYRGFIEYGDGASLRFLRPYLDSMRSSTRQALLPVRVFSGHRLIRMLAWRTPSQEPIGGEVWKDLHFDLTAYLEEARDDPSTPGTLGNGPVLDVLVTNWFDIERSVRLEDLPRMVGQTTGTGVYLRALRAKDQYVRDSVHVRSTVESLESTPEPRGFRVSQRQRDQYQAAQGQAARYRRYLAASPPDLSSLQDAMARWITLTEPTGMPVVRPFAGLTVQVGGQVHLAQPDGPKRISYKKLGR